jgi:hypothetical protein
VKSGGFFVVVLASASLAWTEPAPTGLRAPILLIPG